MIKAEEKVKGLGEPTFLEECEDTSEYVSSFVPFGSLESDIVGRDG